MKISYSWLKDYICADASAEEVNKILTAIGLEVESVEEVESVKGGLHGVVVGHVLTCEQHPDADKLRVTTVDVGGEQPLQIVCGAPNVAVGQKVAVATIGATLFFANGDEVKIKKSKLRGVESYGMICAEDELGIGDSHAGIMTLDANAKVGQPLADFLELKSETVFEIGLTPNRIDAASHVGVARDLAAYLSVHCPEKLKRFSYPSVENFKVDNTSNTCSVKVENTEACPRYCGVTISGVTVKDSPEWLQKRLSVVGLRPINNVVDVTNYVLHELGQPLHAFDADKIEGKTVVVKTCPEGTTFRTLDEVERKLSAQDLMICSVEKPMCIAGVFGGTDSGVTNSARNIFLESACFSPVWVRKTAKRHALSTDASFRYERGADPNIPLTALKRAAMLIKELGGGSISSEVVDVYPQAVARKNIALTFDYICTSIGKAIDHSVIEKILTALEFEVTRGEGGSITVSVPTYRVDVTRPCDVLEEILRIYGYNNVEIPQHVHASLNHIGKPDNEQMVSTAATLLSSRGFNEIMCLSQTNARRYDELHTCPPDKLALLQNPNSAELNAMRQTLLFGGLEAVAYNINRRQSDLKLYEFGNVYCKLAPTGSVTERFSEELRLGVFVTGALHKKSWNEPQALSNFFTLKQHVELLLQRFGVNLHALQSAELPIDIFTDGAAYKLGGRNFLSMGAVSKKLRDMFDIKQEVYFAELRWPPLLGFVAKQKIACTELPKYPEVNRDLALLVDKGVTFAQLRGAAYKAEKKLLRSVGLFDVYEGDKLPDGKKSYALSFTLQDSERTLTDSDIERIMGNLARAFEKEFGAQVRGAEM
ncbi:MAG: phenylalanine--tRNA ligase subunit beta [Prevotellaceae bacterium]|jgi:phenylalanyl-tRNA synthetase beta chain|nr:phenylalanine--tRNA ligase subunit beta [Prevotellaceae bacterium]